MSFRLALWWVASGGVHSLAVGSHRWCSAWRGGGNGIHIDLGESKPVTHWARRRRALRSLENPRRVKLAPVILVAQMAWPIGGRYMAENPDHDREEVPGRPAVSSENLREQAQEGREQQAEEGRGDPATRLRLFVQRLIGRR